MKLYEQQSAFAKDVADLILYIQDQGYHSTFSETYKDAADKESLHSIRLAADLNIMDVTGNQVDAARYKEFGTYWESLNRLNRWGGNNFVPMTNHFERLERE